MFTGIITELGTVQRISRTDEGVHFTIRAPKIAAQLSVGASISVNGACHTVTHADRKTFTVTSVRETLQRTTLGSLAQNDTVNLELPVAANGRLDGHMVLGHIDTTAIVTDVHRVQDQTRITFRIGNRHTRYITEKGSVAINGVSLTVTEVSDDSFSIVLIPHTQITTTLGEIGLGIQVNVELDQVAKLTEKWLQDDKKHHPEQLHKSASQKPLPAHATKDIAIHEGIVDGTQMHIAIVLSRFNENIGTILLTKAIETLEANGMTRDRIDIVRVPGALEIPSAAQVLISHNVYDAIIALGVVIRGETSHYDQICNTVARTLNTMSIKTETPVIYGILTTETLAQAQVRADGTHSDTGADAARSAVEMAALFRQLKSSERFTLLRTRITGIEFE